MSTQKFTSLASQEPTQKFSVGGWVVLKATLVFSFGPNWNLSSDLNQAEQLLNNFLSSIVNYVLSSTHRMPLLRPILETACTGYGKNVPLPLDAQGEILMKTRLKHPV